MELAHQSLLQGLLLRSWLPVVRLTPIVSNGGLYVKESSRRVANDASDDHGTASRSHWSLIIRMEIVRIIASPTCDFYVLTAMLEHQPIEA